MDRKLVKEKQNKTQENGNKVKLNKIGAKKEEIPANKAKRSKKTEARSQGKKKLQLPS